MHPSYWRRKQIENKQLELRKHNNELVKLIVDDQFSRFYEEAYEQLYGLQASVHKSSEGWYYIQTARGRSKNMRMADILKQAQILYAKKLEQDNESPT